MCCLNTVYTVLVHKVLLGMYLIYDSPSLGIQLHTATFSVMLLLDRLAWGFGPSPLGHAFVAMACAHCPGRAADLVKPHLLGNTPAIQQFGCDAAQIRSDGFVSVTVLVVNGRHDGRELFKFGTRCIRSPEKSID